MERRLRECATLLGLFLYLAAVALKSVGGFGLISERRYERASASQREIIISGSLLLARNNVTGMNLWLVPVVERSFQRTLAEPVDLSDWEDRPDTYPQSARIWGVRTDSEQGDWERNLRNLEKMEPGDPLLVYRNSVSRYTSTGRVGQIAHTEYVRDEFWGGGPALDVYVVEEYEDSIDAEPEVVNQLLGYQETFWPQGFWRVSDDRPIDKVVRELDM